VKRNQKGYGIVEYLLGAAVLSGILFLPVNKGQSVSMMLIDAVKKEHAAYIHVSSMANVTAAMKVLKKKK